MLLSPFDNCDSELSGLMFSRVSSGTWSLSGSIGVAVFFVLNLSRCSKDISRESVSKERTLSLILQQSVLLAYRS